MLKSNIFKSMKLFIQRHKLLSSIVLIIIIFIPVLVFASNTPGEGYRVRANATSLPIFAYDRQGSLNLTGYCVVNHSAKDYFIPTATDAEHWAFYNAATATSGQVRTDLQLVGCIGDGYCDSAGGETCDSAERACGMCAVPLKGNGYCDPGEDWYNTPEDCPDPCANGGCSGGGGTGAGGECDLGYYNNYDPRCNFFAS